jgi:hypothetical protein
MIAANDLPNALKVYIERYNIWDRARIRGRQETVQTTLYHYTGWAALQGILANQAVWFTHYAHLNDPQELLHGIEVGQDVITVDMLA